MLYHRIGYPVSRRTRPENPMNDLGILLVSSRIRSRAKLGVIAKSPLLYCTNGPIRSIGEMVFVVGGKRENLIAEIADRVWPAQDCFAFDHPVLHRSFISRLNSTAENRCLGPAPECRGIGRQKSGIHQDVVIGPDDIVPFGNIYRSV